MWMTLLALRNSIAILMASLAVVVLGFVALGRLPVDLIPNINLPIINVGTVYTGAGVLDVEKTVTYPIEKAVSAISDVRFVESKSRQGLSTVRVWMNWGADVNDGQTEVIQRIQQILNTLLPPGFSVRLGGQSERQREAFGSLYFTSVLAIILVYMVLASQFRSLKDPLTIMFSVPMGLIGVFWALFLTDTTLSTTSFMGIIMMVGIVVSNGVLLVEYINELRRQGLPLHEAVPRGGRVRLRPILMTVLATVVGLLPMALALGVGTEANQPLAIAVIGGLVVSTFFTLVLIPTLYVIFEERFPRTFDGLTSEDAERPAD